MAKLVWALLAALLLTSCRADPHTALIPNDPAQWDKELGERIKDLDAEEKQLIAEYLVRVKLGEAFGGTGIPPGTTVGDAVKQQRDFKAQQLLTATVVAQSNIAATATAAVIVQQRAAATATTQALREQLSQERARALAEFANALTVTLVSKEYVPAGTDRFQFSDQARVMVGMRNTSDKEIQTFRGTLRVADQFDQEIETNSWTYDRPLSPGGTATYVWNVSTFGNGRRLRDLSTEQLRFTFSPVSIIFADGSRLDMPSDR